MLLVVFWWVVERLSGWGEQRRLIFVDGVLLGVVDVGVFRSASEEVVYLVGVL